MAKFDPYERFSQDQNIDSIEFSTKKSENELFLIICAMIFCTIVGEITTDIIFSILILIFFRVQKSKKEYNRIIFTPKIIKLLSENDSFHNVFYQVSNISFIRIRLEKVYRYGKSYYRLFVDLELINDKKKTINFDDFLSRTDSLTGFQASRIYNFCHKYYKMPIDTDYE